MKKKQTILSIDTTQTRKTVVKLTSGENILEEVV